jgi:hypothetical protein
LVHFRVNDCCLPGSAHVSRFPHSATRPGGQLARLSVWRIVAGWCGGRSPRRCLPVAVIATHPRSARASSPLRAVATNCALTDARRVVPLSETPGVATASKAAQERRTAQAAVRAVRRRRGIGSLVSFRAPESCAATADALPVDRWYRRVRTFGPPWNEGRLERASRGLLIGPLRAPRASCSGRSTRPIGAPGAPRRRSRSVLCRRCGPARW